MAKESQTRQSAAHAERETNMNRREFTYGLLGTAGALTLRRSGLRPQPKLRVNGARLNEHLKALSAFGKNPQGGVSRVAYSEADRLGRDYVSGLMRAAKLDVSVDAAGNIIGRRPAANNDDSLRPILFGSHIDSVPEGGNFDGNVGSLAAIEVAQTLFENNVMTRHPLEVVIFQNEEGGLIGSRAMDGELGEKGTRSRQPQRQDDSRRDQVYWRRSGQAGDG
jgi:N-carbamoyl-L-amino-acid hydrolase